MEFEREKCSICQTKILFGVLFNSILQMTELRFYGPLNPSIKGKRPLLIKEAIIKLIDAMIAKQQMQSVLQPFDDAASV